MEICKTRTEKLSPDVFNFNVILAGQDKATDAGQATKFKRKLKAPWLQTKVWKMKDVLETWVSTDKSSIISDGEKINNISSID